MRAPATATGRRAGSFHLHDGFVFEAFAPLAVFDRFGAWRWRRGEKGLGEFLAERILHKGRRVGENRFDFFFKPGFVTTAEDETGDEASRAAGGFAEWHAESNEIFGIHWRFT